MPAALPTHALPEGTKLAQNSYVLGGVIGQGGFGITYRATDVRLQRAVAVKEFFPAGCMRHGFTVVPTGGWTVQVYGDARARFLLEGQALGRFNHVSIVHVYAAIEENNTVYLVMELIDGKDLATLLHARGGRMEEAEALHYGLRVCEALEAVHAAGLLHRDIKPANVMVTAAGRVVLIDFGTAREFASQLTQSHSVMLTPGYAPMEQYSERGQRGPYTDFYAVAATLYHLLCGEPPVAATDRVLGGSLTPLWDLNPRVSRPLGMAITQALDMDAARRPQSARAFINMLRSAEAPPPPPVQPAAVIPPTQLAPAPPPWPPPDPRLIPPVPTLIPRERRAAAFVQWILATALGMGIAMAVADGLERASHGHDTAELGFQMLAIVGIGLAAPQWWILRRAAPISPLWVVGSALAMGLSGALAMPKAPAWLLLAPPLLAVAQWWTLRPHVRTAWPWIAAVLLGCLTAALCTPLGDPIEHFARDAFRDLGASVRNALGLGLIGCMLGAALGLAEIPFLGTLRRRP